ncbi:ZF-HD_dimer domain-containing protein [Cephalotus follicularis]|uniref:ZF-HD_dimer domain-containing protein n=1 Tax=Cephalotus follicularis TaxID=3775 RepID=A0A1Q3D7I8_CEPFO|nr:ZF-HD_dimer domain-containing protein [Cephalotus follicularis]
MASPILPITNPKSSSQLTSTKLLLKADTDDPSTSLLISSSFRHKTSIPIKPLLFRTSSYNNTSGASIDTNCYQQPRRRIASESSLCSLSYGDFMPSGEEGTIEALNCSACNCHTNFHRKEIEGEPSSWDCYHNPQHINRIGRKVILGHHHKNLKAPEAFGYPTGTLISSRAAAHIYKKKNRFHYLKMNK